MALSSMRNPAMKEGERAQATKIDDDDEMLRNNRSFL